MSSSRPKRLLTGLVCALALLGVGATSGCTNLEGSAPEKITLGYSAYPGWLPWKVAEAQGLFAENGIDVQLKFYNSITEANTAMASGVLDANNQSLNDTLSELTNGAKPEKIITINDTSTGADQIIAKDGINSLGELRGKSIAVEKGIVDHYWLALALREVGLTFADVKLKLVNTEAGATAFAKGQVDAVVAHAPYNTDALQRKGSRAIATTAEFPNACSDHLVVSDEMIKKRPDDVQALVDTWFDTLDWINANKDAATKIMASQAGVDPGSYASYSAGLSMFTRQQNVDAFTPGMSAKNLNYQAADIADFLVESQLTKTRPDVDGLLQDRFVKAAAQ
jgi:NitT/TauT family transport system substrate-binding protein